MTLRDSVVILNSYISRDSVLVVIVELLGGNGQWHLLDGATAERLDSGVYEVTIAGIAEMWLALWLASPDRFAGMMLRIDSRETRATADVRRKNDRLVLKAVAEKSEPRL